MKLDFASCVVHHTRSYSMVFVNQTYDVIINTYTILHQTRSYNMGFVNQTYDVIINTYIII